MGELQVTHYTIVLPTGEAISPEDTPLVAKALVEMRELRRRLNDATAMLTDALVEYGQRVGAKTFRLEGVGKVELVGGPESELQWDMELLEELRTAGLPEERWNELVTMEVSYKINAAVAKQIEAANERYAVIVQAARRRVDKRWGARIS